MPMLLLSQRYSGDSNAMWRAALDAGWDVERVRGFRCDPELGGWDPVIYGETIFADALMEPLGLALLEPTADWLPRVPERYRRRSIRLTTLGEAQGLEERAFVKPPDEKWFPARVYERGAEIEAGPELSLDLTVIVSEPVVFEVEFRCFVLERKVVAMSPYVREGEIAMRGGEWPAAEEEVAEATAFASALVGDATVELPAAVVVDVGRTQDRGWVVVEANAAWASGLCGTDPRAVLAVIRRASMPRGAVGEGDRRWVRSGGP